MLLGHQPWVYVGVDTSVGEAKLYLLNELDILLASLLEFTVVVVQSVLGS